MPGGEFVSTRRDYKPEEILHRSTEEMELHEEQATSGRTADERAAVQAVLASNTFNKRPRLASLLSYICERYFEADTEGIKEYSIAIDVFRRPQSFDQATDSIVRVEVFRLRKKLREFYDGEGSDQPIEIVVATGHYRPEFIDRNPSTRPPTFSPDSSQPPFPPTPDHPPTAIDQPPQPLPSPATVTITSSRRTFLRVGVALALIAIAASALWWSARVRRPNINTSPPPSASSPALLPAGEDIRIRCGYSRPMFKDEEGTVWLGDRYSTGGFVTELRDQHIARTRNPELYLTARTGVFSYKIPLAPGTYELRLHFAETTYSPSSSLGGGENSRVFDVQLNNRPLLTQFDIVSDAGPNTADVRVFRDIHPAADGYLHLDFAGSLGLPLLNAIEIVPGIPHHLRPIRMVAQNSFFVDKSGNLWAPDTYFSSGQLAADKVAISGAAEPGLFAGERYGNFSYALPVDDGTYKLTLYFSEKYFGTDISKKAGAGSRVFDVLCNGVALTRRLDVVKEAGPAHALIKVYHGLRPNAQGKLNLSFVPDINYASVDAIEVEDESP